MNRFAVPLQRKKTFVIIFDIMKKGTYKDKIFNLANSNWGVFTTKKAAEVGVSKTLLYRYAKENPDLEHAARGVWILYDERIDLEFMGDAYAIALSGEGSFLLGSTVLSMLDLCFALPNRAKVAVPSRKGKMSERGIKKIVYKPEPGEVVKYKGIPCQRLEKAFFQPRDAIMSERLIDGVQVAQKRGLLSKSIAKIMVDKFESEMQYGEVATYSA
jgi:hypothetical protein